MGLRFRQSRVITLVLALGSTLVVFAFWTQTWFEFEVPNAATSSRLAVEGVEVAPLVSALAFGVIAALGVILLTGVFVRIVTLVVITLLGVSGLAAVLSVLSNPTASAMRSLSAVTGIDSATGLAEQVASVHTTLWPWMVVMGFVLVTLSAIFGLLTVSAWPTSSQRYVRGETHNAPGSRVSEPWEDLSHGRDPTRE